MREESVTTDKDMAEAKAICNEIGGAILTILGEKQAFTLESLITTLKRLKATDYNYGEERTKAAERALFILGTFL
ncbi:hypothetical protein AAH450_15690 [Erwinia sp. P7711]|uniref:hypothetical protein n=1 Tax=Erwinia sp. P7711 TaxID=3141451 RepID=UPI003198C32A